MDILKSARETTGKGKHTGGEIPPELFSFLCIYAATKGIGKSETIRGALELWKSQVESEEKLIELLMSKVQNEWNIFRAQRESFNQFITLVEKKLKQKGISHLLIQKILDQIKE